MREQLPVIDILIGRDGSAVRTYQAANSWRGGVLRRKNDECGDVFPVGRLHPKDLEKFMFETDAPYVGRPTTDGGLEIVARGRAALCRLVWLEDLVKDARGARGA
jgi:hypothetical protein